MDHPSSLPELHFIDQTLDEDASLALFWAHMGSKIGIYWLDFADGYSYIGQSVAAHSRLAAHRRRWNDAVKVRFAPCDPNRLDELELATIQHAQKAQPLRNKLLTDRPGGESDVTFTHSSGKTLPLPWDRARRGPVSAPSPLGSTSAIEKGKARELFGIPQYQALADSTASLIAGALPSPTETQRVLWSVSALPSTNRTTQRQRLLTLSAGRLEILRIFRMEVDGKIVFPSVINVASDARRRDLVRALHRAGLGSDALFIARYRAVTRVQSLEVEDLSSLAQLVSDSAILEPVYRLVITLMRQGSAPLGRFHNGPLARDLLNRALTKQPAR